MPKVAACFLTASMVATSGVYHVLQTFKTQREAIDWAHRQGHHPLVARVRHLNDKKVPGPLAGGLNVRSRDHSGYFRITLAP